MVTRSGEEEANQPGPSQGLANVIYYFQIGIGDWRGTFHLSLTSWSKFWADPIGPKNRFLALSMATLMTLFGGGRITSHLEGFPERGKAGVVANDVRITKFGITAYLLKEQYILHPDGHQVHVQSKERFGPIPFLFNLNKEHPAEILDSGMRSKYYIPLLGTQWVAEYTVRQDRNHIDSYMVCSWGEAQEVIDRVR
jgi:hypothetical protein